MRYILIFLTVTFAFTSTSYAKKKTYKITVTNGCKKDVTVRVLRNKWPQYFVGWCTKAKLKPGETKTLTCKWKKDKGIVLAPINHKYCFESEVRKVRYGIGAKVNARVCKVYKGTSARVTIPAEKGCSTLK